MSARSAPENCVACRAGGVGGEKQIAGVDGRCAGVRIIAIAQNQAARRVTRRRIQGKI